MLDPRNLYWVTCRYADCPDDPKAVIHTHHVYSELELPEFVAQQQAAVAAVAAITPVREVLKVVKVPKEIEALRQAASLQIELWEKLRELEKAVGADLEYLEPLQAACATLDSPVTLDQYPVLCVLLDSILESNDLPEKDYTQDVYEKDNC